MLSAWVNPMPDQTKDRVAVSRFSTKVNQEEISGRFNDVTDLYSGEHILQYWLNQLQA